MNIGASYTLDFFFLILGISIVIDLIVLVGTLRTMRIRKVRMLTALVLISAFILVYLVFTALNLLGYAMVPEAYPGIVLAFAILMVIYLMVLKGMH